MLKDAFYETIQILKSEFERSEFSLLENGKFQAYIQQHTNQLFEFTLHQLEDNYDNCMMKVPFEIIKQRINKDKILILGNKIYTQAKSLAREYTQKIESQKEVFESKVY